MNLARDSQQAADFSIFSYLYRDAGNFKAYGQLLLTGAVSRQHRAVVRRCCEANQYFVAEQVGVPPLYAALYVFSQGPTQDDHAFHEFEALRAATAEEACGLPSGGIDRLVDRFLACAGRWDCLKSPHGLIR